MMLPPTVREDLSDKPGLWCCCSTHRSWHTYTQKYTKPKNKPTQKEIQREKLNMLNSVNCKKGCEICVGDKSGMQHFHRKALFFPFLQHYSVSARWYMLWLGTSKMLTNSYFFFDLPFFLYLTSSQTYTAFLLYQRWKIPSFYFSVRFIVWIFLIFYSFSCLTFRFWKSFYRHFSAFHL